MTKQITAIWPSTLNEDQDEPEHQHVESACLERSDQM